MVFIADIDLSPSIGGAIAMAVVPLLTRLFGRHTQRQTEENSERTVSFPSIWRIATIIGWVVLSVGAIGQFFVTDKDAEKKLSDIVMLYALLLLPLHLEVFGFHIAWDDQYIYTTSGWRPKRVIPFSAVRSCVLIESSHWYIIRTEGYGVIRVTLLARGVPQLIAALPCEVSVA